MVPIIPNRRSGGRAYLQKPGTESTCYAVMLDLRFVIKKIKKLNLVDFEIMGMFLKINGAFLRYYLRPYSLTLLAILQLW